MCKKYFSGTEEYVDEHAAFFQTSNVDFMQRYKSTSKRDMNPNDIRKLAQHEGIGLLKVNSGSFRNNADVLMQEITTFDRKFNIIMKDLITVLNNRTSHGELAFL